MDGSALKALAPATGFFLSVFGLSSMRETVAGLGAGAGAGLAGSAGLPLDPESPEEEDRAVVFLAADVGFAGFWVVERGDRVAIQCVLREARGGEGRW